MPQFAGLTVGVTIGNTNVSVSVSEDMVGHKFGEFASANGSKRKSGDAVYTYRKKKTK